MLVYLATNLRTGLRYVGATKLCLPKRQKEHRLRASCSGKKAHTKFQIAIREDGWGSFEWSVLSECGSVEEMMAEERRWIAELDTQNPVRGYNMTKGGCGVVGREVSDATRLKLAIAGTGRVKSEETRLKLSLANKGKKPSEATLEARRHRKMTEEERRWIGNVNRNRQHIWSDDQRAKYYAGQQRRKENDKNTKVPHSHLARVRDRRARGESFASIGKTYGVHASTLFSWLGRRASS